VIWTQQRTKKERFSIRKKRALTKQSLLAKEFNKISKELKYREEEKGRLSEEKVNLALNHLQKKLSSWVCFEHYPTKKNGKKDRQGIDHIINFIFPEKEKIKFQIKSSERGARHHRQKYPNIPVVVINVSKEELISGRVLSVKEAETVLLTELLKDYLENNIGKDKYQMILNTITKQAWFKNQAWFFLKLCYN